MKTTALLFTGVDRVELAETYLPEPGRSQVVVEAIYTAISPGTETRCLGGKQFDATFPFIPGYSMVGRVAARGTGVGLAEGALVFCTGTERADHPLLWGAHMAHALCNADRVHVLPAGVDPLDASLTKLAAIAYRGVSVAETRPHEEVAVVGLGVIGQLAARLQALAGARVVAADLDPSRVALAKSAGIDAMVPAEGLVAAFQPRQPQGADVVVDSTGVPSVLPQAVLLARLKPWDDALTAPARLVVQGSYPDNVTFEYHQAFIRELSVLFPRDNQPHDIQTVLRFLAEGRLKTRDLVTEVASPADAQETYHLVSAPKPGMLTAVFKWSQVSAAPLPAPPP
jgi:2-desacetyl-2-hydroxyethyl bacteriochlorophyllide A dehydrogenase